nr:gametocyte-specific factor 1 homolog [Leptinotarsa decemlineata]
METHNEGEEKVQCPHDPSHFIRKSRMSTHLVKCKRNYPDTKKVACDFNVNHIIDERDRRNHHAICPDRREMEMAVHCEAGPQNNRFPIPEINVPQGESWDDSNYETYDPKKRCEKLQIVRQVVLESASKKKRFKMAERMKMTQLSNPVTRTNENNSETSGRKSPEPSSRSTLNHLGPSRRDLPETRDNILTENTPPSNENLLQKTKKKQKKNK